ncbi:hypothetical protein LTR10_015112 [Elasticomyces elasticus]|uniref:Zn(2)-C6 fungal-type domain-containing protein n=1 Tax=Exophiala sideris TaxID=1016849 RepID=A0ABR0JQX9_9EURO|nr:hypothetical protein LTR10_015112 [Elasticomyces elasticus]KAK5034690.1 hypothetical protein LTR13_006346 [Exophiala sideris]KAK5039988.1 hypothetical protein LTS07_000483 [Exophiala sideris]KAK5068366.1 hypothetical protein LTR69_000484 [Exophiala sideris]KAK5187668.1 hypothetical protein LTR44_000484 [Eurotiomycetes sp. CCFEE 6388]
MSNAADRPTKAFSCIRCFERKVKCDKQNPCTNCAKSQVECVFRVPPPPRRRKKRLQEDALLERLRKCEQLLKSKGISVDGTPSTTESPTVGSDTPTVPPTDDFAAALSRFAVLPQFPASKNGQLLVNQGKSRFIENNLWTSVANEFHGNEAIGEHYSEDEDEDGTPVGESSDFIFGYTPSSNNIQNLHPPPEHIMVLWQAFLDNINPMSKVIHYPTFQQTLIQASTHLDNLPRALEALMFSIYNAAIFSMDDDECGMKLGESRKTLLARYRHATRKALARAQFLGTSDIQVLQAFLLYLITMREEYDSRTTWTLTGVASRIAQGMGLHRDGTTFGMAPFENEMRRRLWWQLMNLDFRSAELSGSGRFVDIELFDTKPPRNIDDADIWPEMKEPPIAGEKPTEMIACMLRTEFGSFWKEKVQTKKNVSFENLRISSPWTTSLEERDAHINELEQRIEERYLRYCDPSIPIQFMCIIMGRAAMNSMRLMAHHPRKYPDPDKLPQSERDLLWKLCINLVETDNLAHASKGIRKFMWHINVHFQWQALIYLLDELRTHTLGDKVDKAWEGIGELFQNHWVFVTNNKKPLHVAVGSLCLKAYSAREAALREKTNGVYPKVIPEYIRLLREQRKNVPVMNAASKTEVEPGKPGIATDLSSVPTSQWQENLSTDYSQQQPLSQQNFGIQQPLPAFLPPQATAQAQLPTLPTDEWMFPSDPTLMQDLAMADLPMDWAQWDFAMQDLTSGSADWSRKG